MGENKPCMMSSRAGWWNPPFLVVCAHEMRGSTLWELNDKDKTKPKTPSFIRHSSLILSLRSDHVGWSRSHFSETSKEKFNLWGTDDNYGSVLVWKLFMTCLYGFNKKTSQFSKSYLHDKVRGISIFAW